MQKFNVLKCIQFSLKYINKITNIILYILYAAEGKIRESIDIKEPMNTSKKDMNGLAVVPARLAILKTIISKNEVKIS